MGELIGISVGIDLLWGCGVCDGNANVGDGVVDGICGADGNRDEQKQIQLLTTA